MTGSIYNPGNFYLRAYNDVEAYDDVKLDSGGVIVGSGVTSWIKADVNDAVAKIGDNVIANTVGDIDMETLTRGVLKVEPQVKTYGLASAGKVDGLASIHNNNQVVIGENSDIEAMGDMNLLSGRDRDGNLNYFHVTSHGDELNASALPISFLKSHGEIIQDHSISVGSGTNIRLARDANLFAEQDGNAEIRAYGSGKNWMSAVADGIDSMLGSDGISEEMKGGTSTLETNCRVTIDGTVEVGVFKDQALEIDVDGTVIRHTDGITFTTSEQSLAQNLIQEREHWYSLLEEYAGDTISEAAFQAEIDRVEQQMRDLGLATLVTDPDTGEERYVYSGSYVVPYITVDDVWAQAGTITVRADNFYGSGKLDAPNLVTVDIVNHSPSYLRINRITIPDNQGGRVVFNDQDVSSNNEIEDINQDKDTAPAFTEIETAATGGTPQITITNTFNVDDPPYAGDPDYEDVRTPDIELTGDIYAILATLTVTGEGSVISTGNVNVGTLVLNAGKDFVQTYTDSLFNVGGNPGTLWQGVADITQAAKTDRPSVTGDASGSALERAVYDALHTVPDSNIIAANNIYISAAYLNINGLIQSGMADRTVTIEAGEAAKITAAETAYAQYRSGDIDAADLTLSDAGLETTDYVYFKLPNDPDENIDVYWNARLDRLETESVRIQGGYMQLFGRILSTGNGQLKVMNGYGSINIDNQTDYTLVTNTLDTGHGVDGLLKITDTSPDYLDGDGNPRVTEYRFVDNHVETTQYYLGDTPSAPIVGTDGVRTAVYDPMAGMRYYWSNGQDYSEQTKTTYASSSWLGIDALVSDPDNIVSGPTKKNVGDIYRLPGAEYMKDSGSVGADYSYDYRRVTTGSTTTKRKTWEESSWTGKKTYYCRVTETKPYKDIHAHSIRADRPIDIEFIGYEAGDPRIRVDVTSAGDIRVNDSVQNAEGNTALISTGGRIELDNGTASVGGKNIDLTAASGIGTESDLRINLNDAYDGRLNAFSIAGDIGIQEISGDLKVDHVITDNTSGDVALTAYGSILAQDAGSLVQGGKIDLVARYGDIGSLGTGGTAATPAVDALSLNINTGTSERDQLQVVAAGDVFITETDGTLNLWSLETNGNVRLVVANGDLADVNTNEIRDTRTEQQLMDLWDRMLATGTTAQQSLDATIDAYESVKTRDYRSYWIYRNMQADPSVYDPDFQVTLSASEEAAYRDYYAGQGMTPAEIDAAIITLENMRTTEYHTLHKTYGNITATYDDTWTYDVDDVTLHQRFGAAEISGDTIRVGTHVFTTGQAVVYHSGGGEITGLVDGETYYVAVDADDPELIGLAATQEDANAGTLISLTHVSGSDHYFSDGDVLVQRGVWSESQLKNSISASILRPKSVPGSSTTIEDPNVVGNDVALVASGRIGVADGQVDINLPLSDALTDDEKLALAAAEREDVTFYDDTGTEMEADDTDRTAVRVVINLTETLDIEASGLVTVNAGADGAYLGSDQPGDLHINQLTSDGQVRLKARGNVLDGETGNLAANVISNGLIIEASQGSVGSEAAPLLIDMTGTDPALTARAGQDIYIEEISGDLAVSEVFANGTVELTADNNIIDPDDDDATTRYWNIYATSASLTAGGYIGTTDRILEIDLQGGAIDAQAMSDIFMDEVTTNMLVGEVRSTAGNVRLRADSSILDAADDLEADVVGNSITLIADYGAIGASGGNALDIDSAFSAAGTLTSSSEFNTYIVETLGNLAVNTVSTPAGTAFISALTGSITNGRADSGPNVLAGKTWLFARDDIGAEGKALATQVGNIEGKTTSGTSWIENSGALTVGGVTDTDPGYSGGADANIGASSPITVIEDMTACGTIILWSHDSPGPGDDITISGGVTVTSENAHVFLRAGDNVYLSGQSDLFGGSDITGNLIDIGPHGFDTGQAVVYHSGGGEITGLVDGETYYVAVDPVDPDKVGLAATEADAVAGTTIALTWVSGVDHYLGDEATINAAHDVRIWGDYHDVAQPDPDAPDVGSIIELWGSISAEHLYVYGNEDDDEVVLDLAPMAGGFNTPTEIEAGEGDDLVHICSVSGMTNALGNDGDDTFVVDEMPPLTSDTIGVRDTVNLDGEEGVDSYIVNLTPGGSDYIVNVHDSGTVGADADLLTINGTDDADSFLLRQNFVAALDGAVVERVNYDATLNGGLIINGGLGDDSFYCDDNGIITTLNGDAGSDYFHVGQLFGSERDAAAGILPGDEFDTETVETTHGFLSKGVSYATIADGGMGNDLFVVYNNQATLDLQGGNDNDAYIFRAFVLAADDSYVIKEPVDIDGGTGSNRADVMGTELADALVVNQDGVYGAGLNIDMTNIWARDVDGLEGDDAFYIQSTLAGTATTVIGGKGSDFFSVAGDVTKTVVSTGMAFPVLTHEADRIQGSLTIDSGLGSLDHSLVSGVMLPWETDTLPLPEPVIPPETDPVVNRMTVYDDSSVSDDTGLLSDTTISGLGMGSTITYSDMQTVEVLLGTGNDIFTVTDTAAGTITAVHGGGGDDHLIATGGGGAGSPLILFGDTSDDGSRYASTAGTPSDSANVFAGVGNNTIDASLSTAGVAIYGGGGDDLIYGSQGDDHIAGGEGDDEIYGTGGNNHIYGDSAFNINLPDHDLTVVTTGAPGSDTIAGGLGNDIIFGDHGIITQVAGTVRLYTTGSVTQVETTSIDTGGADTIDAGQGDNVVFGGGSGDSITSGDGDNIVFGDNGRITYDTDGTPLVLETTDTADHPEYGGDDDITLGDGDNDDITSGGGADIILGDNGQITYTGPTGSLELSGIVSTEISTGGADVIDSGDGYKTVVGGFGADRFTAGAGNHIVIGDNGRITYDTNGDPDIFETIDTAANAGYGGDDTVTLGDGNNVFLGGMGGDQLTSGNGLDVVLGDNGTVDSSGSMNDLVLQDIVTVEPSAGGDDTVITLNGDKTVVGGFGADNVDAGIGNHIVIGDNGHINYNGGNPVLFETTDTAANNANGGNDVITLDDGNGVVFGGMADDIITTADGTDVIFGDNGRIVSSGSMDDLVLSGVVSTEPSAGGDDIINTGNGHKTIIDGFGSDQTTAGEGDHVVIGDNGRITYDTDGTPLVLETTDTWVTGTVLYLAVWALMILPPVTAQTLFLEITVK
ncbi:MAG: hypothetical protein B5M56_00340 [Desulfococcus sp. 4484_241]|nr:MAG: hypothetical protein B5M56_00340 [Desulfococcus sp. 4484_241]